MIDSFANTKIIAEDPACAPTYGSEDAAGADLRAFIPHNEIIFPGQRKLIPTGIKIGLRPGTEAQVRSRSGLALKKGIVVLNSPGTIDSDYHGPIGVILYNTGDKPYIVEPMDRIAQLVIAPVYQARWIRVDSFDYSERGEGGFGSTGVK